MRGAMGSACRRTVERQPRGQPGAQANQRLQQLHSSLCGQQASSAKRRSAAPTCTCTACGARVSPSSTRSLAAALSSSASGLGLPSAPHRAGAGRCRRAVRGWAGAGTQRRQTSGGGGDSGSGRCPSCMHCIGPSSPAAIHPRRMRALAPAWQRTLSGPVSLDQVFKGDGGHLAGRRVNALLQRAAQQVHHLSARMLGLRAGRGRQARATRGGSWANRRTSRRRRRHGMPPPLAAGKRLAHTWLSASSAALRIAGSGDWQAVHAATSCAGSMAWRLLPAPSFRASRMQGDCDAAMGPPHACRFLTAPPAPMWRRR